MNFVLERITDPEIEPVTLAEMKRHLRCYDDVTVEDADITGLIVSAREWVEEYTGRALVDQTWRLTIQGRLGVSFGGDIVGGLRGAGQVNPGIERGLWRWGRHGQIMLRRAPVLAITSFVSVDMAGVETAVDAATYELCEGKSKWPRIVALNGASWSTGLTGDLRVEFRAGFADRLGSPKGDATVVPTRFRQAMKLWAEANYDRDPIMMPLLLKVAEQIVQPERSHLQIA